MTLKNGIIFIWTGTHASIPAGWSRVTDMDDKYPKGTADVTDPNTTGGNATHSHTSPTHTHTAGAHTHGITLGTGSGGGGAATSGSNAQVVGHTHGGMTSGAVASFSASSVAATYAAISNNPPYSTVIYITPTTAVSKIPAGVVGLADEAAPANFAACDGAGGTPNLVGKYLLGAATAANAGTTGGSTTNTHDLTHTHTTSHTHAAASSGGGANTGGGTGGSGYVTPGHVHSVTLPAAAPSTADTPSVVTAETVEPAYTKLMAIQASAETSAPYKIIALWLGTLANIPRGWKLCDGTGGTIDMRDRHLKITATVGEIGNTGGANTHTHASQNHTHAVLSHTHNTSIDHTGHTNVNKSGTSGTAPATSGTTHSITTVSGDLALAAGATTADSANNEPPYRTVAFIKLVSISNPGEFILNFIH